MSAYANKVLDRKMEEKMDQILQDSCIPCRNQTKDQWLSTEDEDDDDENSMLSRGSTLSSSSYDTVDDDASSSSNSGGSSYDLSELMMQLPIKRGLSKFYDGKSESFTSLSRVASVEDLVKKTTPLKRRRMKLSKSCENGFQTYKSYILPKPIISKAKKLDARGTSLSSKIPSRKGEFSLTHLQRKLEC